jgi:peptidyl-tRNA hydrolase
MSNTISDTKTDDIVMYIFVNRDLKMGCGKIASQVGHAVHMIVDDILTNAYEMSYESDPSVLINYKYYKEWMNGFTKIVLKASEEQLNNIILSEKIKFMVDDGFITSVAMYPKPRSHCSKYFDFQLC